MTIVACVGVIIRDEARRIVVIRRGRPPSVGLWSIPGGRVEPDEAVESAARREAREETGLDIIVVGLAGRVLLAALEPDDVYDVADYLAVVSAGTPTEPIAGDDAADARWVTRDELVDLATTPRLVETLDSWHVWTSPVDALRSSSSAAGRPSRGRRP